MENAENCNPINGLRLQCLAYPQKREPRQRIKI